MAMGLLYIPVLFLKELQLLDSTQRKKMCQPITTRTQPCQKNVKCWQSESVIWHYQRKKIKNIFTKLFLLLFGL
jgi:hypothetical protein